MRPRQVIVQFGDDKELDLKLTAADGARTRESARDWFDREFIALECDVASPIGKVLSADRVLSVAKYAGFKRFQDDPKWAAEYAQNAAALLDADFIRVDVPNYSIGY
ncbi:MAG TPA: hypothetical protein VMK32_00470 [Burkholderiaceae bacterium]|nr:hypothetical protein [Burkholderiaceae bacterium]